MFLEVNTSTVTSECLKNVQIVLDIKSSLNNGEAVEKLQKMDYEETLNTLRPHL